jgi:hypothetical protein
MLRSARKQKWANEKPDETDSQAIPKRVPGDSAVFG